MQLERKEERERGLDLDGWLDGWRCESNAFLEGVQRGGMKRRDKTGLGIWEFGNLGGEKEGGGGGSRETGSRTNEHSRARHARVRYIGF